MNLKSMTTFGAVLLSATLLGGVAFAQSAPEPKPSPKPADEPKKPEEVKPGETKKGDETKKAEDPSAKFLKGFYGTMDASVDDTTKGIAGKIATHWDLANFPPDRTTLVTSIHTPPVGRVDYMLAESTNKSGVGYRGDHAIGKSGTSFVYQIEASLSITSSPGLATSYVQQSNVVKSFGFGDSFLGLKGNWGAFKLGTTYAPYKKSTDRLNPFSGMLGDYAVVMGNSGGDNRVEFGTRLDHSMWYESPKFADGFNLDVLFSPGQNRTFDNVIQSAGSPDCNGGNEPGSGNLPLNCDDGGFDNAFSASLRYDNHGFYAAAAYEWHHNVNRNSDGIGSNNFQYALFAFDRPDLVVNANNNPQGLPPAALGGYLTDIGDESAYKVGLQYRFPFKFTLGGIYEWLRRDIPSYLTFQNERSRNGWWLTATQEFGSKGSLSIGWAHAAKTPGDPGGQHNFIPTFVPGITPPAGASFAKDDTADMYTVAYKHKLDKQLYIYLDYANTTNHGNAHYDLGAGGRGLTTDCHDGTSTAFIDYSSAGPTTWGGCHIQGFSAGLHYVF